MSALESWIFIALALTAAGAAFAAAVYWNVTDGPNPLSLVLANVAAILLGLGVAGLLGAFDY